MIINISEAQIHLSDLVQRAAHGEEIVISKNNIPLIELITYRPKPVYKVILGLLGDHPSSDTLNAVLDIDISDLWEESGYLPNKDMTNDSLCKLYDCELI